MKEIRVTSYTLKLIAIVTMLTDHTGAMLGDVYGWGGWYWIMRRIGRIAFPIFAFLLVEGFSHTRNRWLYLRNLLLFALIAEWPFDMLFFRERPGAGMNIFWTLSLGLLGMIASDAVLRRCREGHYIPPVTVVCTVLPMLAMAFAGEFLRVDYNAWGVILIALIYYADGLSPYLSEWFRDSRLVKNILASAAVLAWMVLYDWARGWGVIECYGAAALLPILLYNGERGSYRLSKWFFYGFYPAHILILAIIRKITMGI